MHLFPIDRDVQAVLQLGLWLYPEGERPDFETPGEVTLPLQDYLALVKEAERLEREGREPVEPSRAEIVAVRRTAESSRFHRSYRSACRTC